jgi:TPR repeat protein
MVTGMDKTSWYRRFFPQSQKFDLKATRAKADQGDAEAQFALGLKYGIAEGEFQDLGQAAQWYRKAAEQNHALAQFNLGLMYAKGDGVPQDDAEAVRWIRMAAHQGDAGAQFDLGLRYQRASLWGLQLDGLVSKIEAYKWLQLAATQGYKGSAEACGRATLSMTCEEVADGNRGAVAFVPGDQGAPRVR